MKSNISITFLLMAIACGDNIGIAPEKGQNDTYDSIQEFPESDSAVPEQQDEDTAEQEEIDPLTDFLQPGPHYPYGISVEDRTVDVTGCQSMEYKVYTPYATNPPVVILGHGFARGADSMTGWAEHLSSWGVEVILPTLCHYNVFAGVNHEMNGQNMKELAIAHGATEVVYAGHSAGGLAAIIAASQDDGAIGVLGLDATDTENVPGVEDFIGQRYASDVLCKAYSIMGEQSTCNSDNNGLDLFQMMPNAQIVKVASADHCDFESPTDWICESQCENPSTVFSDEEIRPIITTLGTAAIMSLTGLSADGAIIWTDGLEEWKITGVIQELE